MLVVHVHDIRVMARIYEGEAWLYLTRRPDDALQDPMFDTSLSQRICSKLSGNGTLNLRSYHKHAAVKPTKGQDECHFNDIPIQKQETCLPMAIELCGTLHIALSVAWIS